VRAAPSEPGVSYDAVQLSVGVPAVPDVLPRKPNVVLPPAARLPFHETFLAVTLLPAADIEAFHT
jgi:hypothetical protein